MTRSAVEAVGAVRARCTPFGAGAAIVAIAIEGVRWISDARVRAECCLKRAAVRLADRGDVLAERDCALGARAKGGGDEQEGTPKEAPHFDKKGMKSSLSFLSRRCPHSEARTSNETNPAFGTVLYRYFVLFR